MQRTYRSRSRGHLIALLLAGSSLGYPMGQWSERLFRELPENTIIEPTDVIHPFHPVDLDRYVPYKTVVTPDLVARHFMPVKGMAYGSNNPTHIFVKSLPRPPPSRMPGITARLWVVYG